MEGIWHKWVLIILIFTCTELVMGQNLATIQFDSSYAYHWTASDWRLQYRTTFNYNEAGQETEQIRSDWTGQPIRWLPAYRELHVYSEEGWLLERAKFKWSNSFDRWEGVAYDTRVLYVYNQLGQIVEWTAYSWSDSSKKWENLSRWTLKYDVNGNLVEEIREEWNVQLLGWTNSLHVLYLFDNEDKVLEKTSETWDEYTSSWAHQFKVRFTYDEQGDKIQEISDQWDEGSSDWNPSTIRTFQYDEDGHVIEETSGDWIQELMQWQPNRRVVFDYDENQNRIEYSIYDWQSATVSWLLLYQQLDTFNADGQWIEQMVLSKKWPPDGANITYVGTRMIQNYDLQDRLVERLEYQSDEPEVFWNNTRRSTWEYKDSIQEVEQIDYLWDTNSNDWLKSFRLVSWWTDDAITSALIPSESPYQIYPNPMHNFLIVENQSSSTIDQIDWIDASGRVVRTCRDLAPGANQLERGVLSSGSYWIRIHADRSYVLPVIVH